MKAKMLFRHIFYYLVGIGFLALAKAKNLLQGYSSPKPFDNSQTEKCIEYDIGVAEHWLLQLEKYTHNPNLLIGKNVLELGPGSDFGVGIYLLSLGCAKYNACDVNNLMRATPDSFYQSLFRSIEDMNDQADMRVLEESLRQANLESPSRLNLVVQDDFDLVAAFGTDAIDLVFSQAAFEHFDDIETTVSQLDAVCKPGAILIAEVDLKTHSRWIRDKDPNNIYRYSTNVYKAFGFRGAPNRIRPFQYKEALERFGWTDVSITPLQILKHATNGDSGVNKVFVDDKNQMDYLSIMLCARKQDII